MSRRQMGRAAGVLALVGAAVLTGTASAQAATPCPNWGGIPNAGSVIASVQGPAFGVVHLADGNCGRPYYDVSLPAGQSTRGLPWSEVAAVYLAPNYGARIWHDRVRQPDHTPNNTHRWINTSSGGLWEVEQYR